MESSDLLIGILTQLSLGSLRDVRLDKRVRATLNEARIDGLVNFVESDSSGYSRWYISGKGMRFLELY